jgi:hypothetical protein
MSEARATIDGLSKEFDRSVIQTKPGSAKKPATKSPEHRAKIAAAVRETKRARAKPIIVRFMEKVEQTPDGCWGWTASLDDDGYALFSAEGKTVRAFRWIYEWMLATIPADLVPDHKCRNRACVNPFHAEIVTNKVNVLRGVSFAAQNAVATHCKRSHEFTAESINSPTKYVGNPHGMSA